jgi:putative PIG3 family NAD(P)H quinone oxidoreductase
MTGATRARAVVYRGVGGPEVIAFEERTVRDPGPGEIRVAVAATALNRADVLQRRGLYPAPSGAPAEVPGLEYAGTVEAVGEGVCDWREGDRVMGIVGGGGMCSRVVVHAREAIPVPSSLSLEEAAAIPEAFLTAWDALVLQAGLRPGSLVLVHAVGSGVGTAAVQIVRALGAECAGTSRTEEKLGRCAALGLAHGIAVPRDGEPAFASALEARTGRCADVILDTVGAPYLAENVRALAERGTIVTIGLLGGAVGSLPLGALLGRRGRLIGTVLRTRPLEEKAALARAFAREMIPLFERGLLRPVVGAVRPIDEVADAQRAMEKNETFGKIVLRF